ncbi:bifunctional nuclease family protein [Oceanidesulfovibrio marinus]|uniref:Bifunctional nuclease family protein n=1 Tax=Oceanidesulfovibrio marinus TaxID=370038 RepID=A0A6P1ZKL3_9BACT|nr:bifunctional nuclease family protein [Oceanidesulfovibrio marinus]QJT10662.1 bifunctional nuclease family protein [Oceanidesulfovibrio marinus]TVM34110.1 bifunctional nuclease family protein [Oceanidesulfovibrio marinus]
MVEMKVFGLALDEDSQVPVLVLKDLEEKTALPIWIGAMEAMAISLALNGVKLPRPMTHDLLLSTLESLGGKILSVNVVSLKDGTFYAEIEVDQGGSVRKIDCRPSDGIALALRASAPIAVAEDVLEQASTDSIGEGKPVLQSDDAKEWNELLEKLNVDENKYKM